MIYYERTIIRVRVVHAVRLQLFRPQRLYYYYHMTGNRSFSATIVRAGSETFGRKICFALPTFAPRDERPRRNNNIVISDDDNASGAVRRTYCCCTRRQHHDKL